VVVYRVLAETYSGVFYCALAVIYSGLVYRVHAEVCSGAVEKWSTACLPRNLPRPCRDIFWSGLPRA